MGEKVSSLCSKHFWETLKKHGFTSWLIDGPLRTFNMLTCVANLQKDLIQCISETKCIRTQSTRKQKAVSTSPNSKEHSLKNNEPNWKLWFHIRINDVQSSSRKDAKRQGIFKSPLTIQSHILNWVAGIQLRLELLHAIILLPMNIGKKAEVGTRKILVWITNSCLLTKSWEPLGLAAMLQMGPPKASTAYLTFKACKSYSIISPLSPALNSRCPFAQHRASVARDSWPGKNYRNTITSQSTMKSSAPSTWVVTGNRVKTKIPP